MGTLDFGGHAYARTWPEAMARANLRALDRNRHQYVRVIRGAGIRAVPGDGPVKFLIGDRHA